MGTRFGRRLIAVIGAVVLAAGISVNGNTPDAYGEQPADLAPDVTDSAQVSLPVVAHGSLELPRAQEGVRHQVLLEAWPTPEVLGNLEPGDSVRTPVVAKAMATARGDFEIRVGRQGMATIENLASEEGIVNLQVSAPMTATLPFSFPRKLVETDRGPRLKDAGPASQKAAPPDRVVANLPTRSELKTKSTELEIQPYSTQCYWVLRRKYEDIKTRIGGLYSTVRYVHQTFHYQRNSQSELGVGTSSSGNFGSFTQTGTTINSRTGGIDFPALKGKKRKWYYTYFDVGVFRQKCLMGGQNGMYYWRDNWKAMATSWVAASASNNVSSTPRAPYCTPPMSKGTRHTLDTGKAKRWDWGMQTGSVIGVSFSSRTGYGSNVKVTYTPKAKRRIACGQGGKPGSRYARLLVIKRV